MRTTSRKWARLGMACAASLALAACGGGGDDDDGQPETSAACGFGTPGTQSGSYRVEQNGETYTRDTTTTVEPATFNGQQMMRLQHTNLHQLSSGHVLEVFQQHYVVNADGTWSIHAIAQAFQRKNEAQPYQVEAWLYDPPQIDNQPGGMRTGETREVSVKGTRHITENGATRDEPLQYTLRETFHGMEEVTVPLGRFKTCKFTTEQPGAGSSRTTWTSKGWRIKVEGFTNGQRTRLDEATSFSGQ